MLKNRTRNLSNHFPFGTEKIPPAPNSGGGGDSDIVLLGNKLVISLYNSLNSGLLDVFAHFF